MYKTSKLDHIVTVQHMTDNRLWRKGVCKKDDSNFLPVGGWLNTSSRVCNPQDQPPAAIVTNKQKQIMLKNWHVG
jgi:hypothetical protein